MKNNTKKYNAELKKVLMTKDYKELQKFAEKEQGIKMLDNIAELTMHKIIYNKIDLPKDMREESRKWLNERGYSENLD